VTGEVGFLYGEGRPGNFGGEYKEGYIFGEVGNDKIHISAGASYEEWNGRVPRLGTLKNRRRTHLVESK